LYLDTSLLVPLFTTEPLSAKAFEFLRANRTVLIVSNFAAAEFASAIGRRVRMREIVLDNARRLFSMFDGWLARSARRIEITGADVAACDAILRRLDTSLRAPDAIHIAIAQRLDATLVTFDRQMVDGARALGTAVATP
jgi:predicted nucleic acid-binding protein